MFLEFSREKEIHDNLPLAKVIQKIQKIINNIPRKTMQVILKNSFIYFHYSAKWPCVVILLVAKTNVKNCRNSNLHISKNVVVED